MPPPAPTSPKPPRKTRSKKRKWLRRTLIAVGVLIVILIVAPFLFTSSLVRLYLANSEFRHRSVQFASASLSPSGRLTIKNLRIVDTAESQGKPLFTAETARIDFQWAGLNDNRVQSISLENVDATLRPGSDTRLTFLRLLSPGQEKTATSSPATAPATPATPAAAPFWFDQLSITGTIRYESYEPWPALANVAPNQPIPLQASIKMSGDRQSPTRQCSLILGNPDNPAAPSLVSRFSVASTTAQTTLHVEALKTANVHLSKSIIARWTQDFPELALADDATFDALLATGTLTFAETTTLDATVQLNSLSAQTPTTTIKSFGISTKVAGTLSSAPLHDLTFSNTRLTFDDLQHAGWSLSQATLDLSLQKGALILEDLQATLEGAPLRAMAAFDTDARRLTSGRVLLNRINTTPLLAKLPASIRDALPPSIDGILSAAITLRELDQHHITLTADLRSRDQLRFYKTLPTEAAASPAAILTNPAFITTFSWQFGSLPEITHAALTADQFLLFPPPPPPSAGPAQPVDALTATRLSANFTLLHGIARLDDLYALLPGNGRLIAQAFYNINTETLDKAMLSLNGIDASILNPWLPRGYAITGQIDANLGGQATQTLASWNFSLGLASQTTLSLPDGQVTLVGNPSPTVNIDGSWNLNAPIVQIKTATLAGITTMQADAPAIAFVRTLLTPDQSAAAGAFLDRLEKGVSASLDKIAFTGDLDIRDRHAQGMLAINGFDAGIPGDSTAALQNLILTTEFDLPFNSPSIFQALSLTKGEILAEKITLGRNIASEVNLRFSASDGKALFSRSSLAFADGIIEGDATLTLPAQLDIVHANFARINQHTITQAIAPDKFTAEGPISGKLTLLRDSATRTLAGSIDLTADEPGRLKINRDLTKDQIAPKLNEVAQKAGNFLPDNFSDIVMDQLANYPYNTGRATIRDNPAGMTVVLDYRRPPLKEGEPGWGVPMTIQGQRVSVAYELDLTGFSFTVNKSITELLKQMAGLKDSLIPRN